MAFKVLSCFMQKLLYFKISLGVVEGRRGVVPCTQNTEAKLKFYPSRKQSGRTIPLKERSKDPAGLHGCWGGPLVSRTGGPAASRKTAAAAHSLSRLARLARQAGLLVRVRHLRLPVRLGENAAAPVGLLARELLQPGGAWSPSPLLPLGGGRQHRQSARWPS
jgi:hypothetical protein